MNPLEMETYHFYTISLVKVLIDISQCGQNQKKSGRIRESCLRYNEIRKVAAQVLKERKTK